jgi:drug/metabolite transporter (DMT)-like permease
LYLALIGSLIGFAAYYKVLMALPIILVSAITLLTPMLALWLGALLLDEVISSQLIIGSGMILIAVSLYEGVWQGASLLIKRALRLPV